jgi:hypothetical protein
VGWGVWGGGGGGGGAAAALALGVMGWVWRFMMASARLSMASSSMANLLPLRLRLFRLDGEDINSRRQLVTDGGGLQGMMGDTLTTRREGHDSGRVADQRKYTVNRNPAMGTGPEKGDHSKRRWADACPRI